MKNIFTKLAAILAWIIGAMAIFAGGPVLLGRDPGYYVIGWVPLYNFLIGVLSFFLTAILIWKGSRMAVPAAWATLGLHSLVMLILQIAYREVVAVESLTAMTVRIVVWVIILVFLWIGSRVKVRQNVSATGGNL